MASQCDGSCIQYLVNWTITWRCPGSQGDSVSLQRTQIVSDTEAQRNTEMTNGNRSSKTTGRDPTALQCTSNEAAFPVASDLLYIAFSSGVLGCDRSVNAMLYLQFINELTIHFQQLMHLPSLWLSPENGLRSCLGGTYCSSHQSSTLMWASPPLACEINSFGISRKANNYTPTGNNSKDHRKFKNRVQLCYKKSWTGATCLEAWTSKETVTTMDMLHAWIHTLPLELL